MNIRNVRNWAKKIGNRETEIAYKPRSGRPTSSVTDANRDRADELIRGGGQFRILLNISYGSSQGMIAKP